LTPNAWHNTFLLAGLRGKAMLSVEDIVSFFKTYGPVGGVAFIFILIGVALLLYRIHEVGTVGVTPSATVPQQREQITQIAKDTFGDISLMERNEESRRKVSNVLAILKFLGVISSGDTYGIDRFYADLLDVMTVQKGDKAQLDIIRNRLLKLLNDENTTYDPKYLQPYAQSILGMTYLIEGQDRQAGENCLHWVNLAQEGIKSRFADAQVETIVNVRGICYAIRARDVSDATQTPLDRVDYFIKAHGDFLEAWRIRQRLRTNSTIVEYRFFTNHVEWCVDVYSVLAAATSSDRNLAEPQLRKYMIAVDNESARLFGTPLFQCNQYQSRPTIVLFVSAGNAAKRALRLSEVKDIGARRPAIHHNIVLLGVASDRAGSESAETRAAIDAQHGDLLAIPARTEHLRIATRMWLEEYPKDIVERIIEDSPIVPEWIKGTPFEQEYRQVMQELKDGKVQ
jgi:hypothetical protein